MERRSPGSRLCGWILRCQLYEKRRELRLFFGDRSLRRRIENLCFATSTWYQICHESPSRNENQTRERNTRRRSRLFKESRQHPRLRASSRRGRKYWRRVCAGTIKDSKDGGITGTDHFAAKLYWGLSSERRQ